MQHRYLLLLPLFEVVSLAATAPRRALRRDVSVRTNGVCVASLPTASAPHKNLWHGLTNKETADIIGLLHGNSTGLNLTVADDATSWDNKIVSIELLRPNKTEVLPFLDGSGSSPARYAKATLMFGATLSPYVEEYIVGPLPITAASTAMPYTYVNNRLGGGKIPVNNGDFAASAAFGHAILDEAADVTKFLWNMTRADGLKITSAFIAPYAAQNGKVIMWQGVSSSPTDVFDSDTLLPLGLFLRTDITGRDPSKWTVTGWVYNNVFYASLKDLRTAIANPKFVKLGTNLDGEWTHTTQQGDPLPMDDMPPPVLALPGSRRYSVDASENYVTWMDFSFYVTTSRDNGLRLFDIHYKGKRILYELGMEEAAAHYAGIDPLQSGICYFDSMYGFGADIVSLVHGYDCPSYSTYLNATYVDGETTHTQKDGVCLFEMDKGFPIQRHSGNGYVDVTKNVAFTIRSVSTVGNYDYMTSYEFHLDGSIDVSVRASGYIESAFYAHNEDYGFQIHDNLSGSLHDHVLTFKADFDILGEKNSLQKVEIVPSTQKYVWSGNETRNTMKARRTWIKTEDEAKINWSPNGGAMYAVVNKDAKNSFGEYPGYRFNPSAGVIHLTVQNSSVTKNAAHHTSHHFFVTKRKDSEARCSHPYNMLDPNDPVIDFDKYFNGESLDQEDLVVWFNLGMHHMPHTGDLPNTVFSTAHSGMTIEPFNYLAGDPSRATQQQVHITVANNTLQEIKHYRAKNVTCSIDPSQLNPDNSGFTGDIAVYKFPYDGTKPDRVGGK